MFVTAGTNLKFHNWPLEVTQEVLYKPIGFGNISALSWSKDNSFLTFVTEKGNPEIISLKDPENIKNVHTISAVADASTIAFQRTTKRCIGFATNSGQVALYDTKNKFISKLFQSAPCSVNLLDFNVDDTQMAVSCVNGSVLLYDPKRGNVRDTYIASRILPPTTMAYHPSENNILAVGVADGNLLKWDTNVNSVTFSARIHNRSITGLVLPQNSDLVLSVGTDHKFCIHDLNGECIFSSNQQHPLTAIDVSPDGTNVAIGCETGNISVYDIRKLIKPLVTSKAHNSKINRIKFEYGIRYDLRDICEDNLITFQSNQDFTSKHERDNIDNIEKKQELCEIKCAAEKDYKNMLEKLSTPDRKSESETVAINAVKRDVAETMHKGVNELQTHLLAQFGSLHNFIANEFRTINNQMEEKWNVLNTPKKVSVKHLHEVDKNIIEL